jgi:hypothetical protein
MPETHKKEIGKENCKKILDIKNPRIAGVFNPN